MSNTARFFKEIVIQDPNTGADIEVELYVHQNGGIFGVDSSYTDQVSPEADEGYTPPPELVDEYNDGTLEVVMINDPFSDVDNHQVLYLEFIHENVKT